MPHVSTNLRQICTQRQSYVVNCDEILPWELEFTLAKIINSEIEAFISYEELKRKIIERKDFDLKSCFYCLSKQNYFLNIEMLNSFLNFCGLNYKEKDLLPAVKKIDKDQDGKIIFSDFVEFILPIEPFTRIKNTSNSHISSPNLNSFNRSNKNYSIDYEKNKHTPGKIKN